MITVVFFMDDDPTVIDHDCTVVGILVNGEVAPLTLDEALAFAEMTGGAVNIS